MVKYTQMCNVQNAEYYRNNEWQGNHNESLNSRTTTSIENPSNTNHSPSIGSVKKILSVFKM